MKLLLVLTASAIYLLRVLVRYSALVFMNRVPMLSIGDFIEQDKRIMMHGSLNMNSRDWSEVLPAYQVSGVLQWAFFFTLSLILK
jgi:hypothetical protein